MMTKNKTEELAYWESIVTENEFDIDVYKKHYERLNSEMFELKGEMEDRFYTIQEAKKNIDRLKG